MGRLVVGLGSGRSGSTSLARFLGAQPNSFFCHEGAYYRPAFLRYTFGEYLPWDIDEDAFRTWLSELTHAAGEAAFFGDCAFYLLPYTDLIRAAHPEARFICIKRDRAAVVASFLRQHVGTNPWQEHDGSFWLMRMRDRTFPKFDARTKAEAVGKYWDLYSAMTEAYEKKYPDAFRIFDFARLNEQATQVAMLDFAGFPQESRVLKMPVANRSIPRPLMLLANRLSAWFGIMP